MHDMIKTAVRVMRQRGFAVEAVPEGARCLHPRATGSILIAVRGGRLNLSAPIVGSNGAEVGMNVDVPAGGSVPASFEAALMVCRQAVGLPA